MVVAQETIDAQRGGVRSAPGVADPVRAGDVLAYRGGDERKPALRDNAYEHGPRLHAEPSCLAERKRAGVTVPWRDCPGQVEIFLS